jgi:hypothetical protein
VIGTVPSRTSDSRVSNVGIALQGDEAERPGAALDRVDATEHRVDGIGILGAFLAGGQALFGRGQRFFALGEEDGLDFLGVHACAPSNSSASSPIWRAASRRAGEGSITAPSPLRRALTSTWNMAWPTGAGRAVDLHRAGAQRGNQFGQQRLGSRPVAARWQSDRGHRVGFPR